MFRRARLRLTVQYIVLFGVVLGLFSLVFYAGLATILSPTFDVGPELTSEQVAAAAYQSTVERVGLALVAADIVMIALVALAAWGLAERTLRPIREAHLRQRRFVADASHEMRTPLAVIRASAEGALATATGEPQLRAALGANARAATELTRLTNDLLVLARSDELPSRPRGQIDLSVIVAEAAERFSNADPKHPSTRLSLTPDLRVEADPNEVGRIVANLLDNAARYGGPRPARIRTASIDRDAILDVTDEGQGIAAADLDRIFEPFHRVHAEAGAPDGSGLGLAIARSLAERNGGRLTVTSQPGTGATFRLTLPRFN